MDEFKRIPNFKNYAISKEGKVVNFNSLKELKLINGKVNLTSDLGKRTTRRPRLLVRELFGVTK